jgi:hypothetical protein
MPYGTLIEEKVLCSASFEVGAQAIMFVSEAKGDTVWGIEDSVDFSAPVMITVYPYDGITTKTYEARLNVHQVDPESMVWQKHSDFIADRMFRDIQVIRYKDRYSMYAFDGDGYSLYRTDTAEMTVWEKSPLSGLQGNILLSQITEYEGRLYVITEQGELYGSEDGLEWTKDGDAPKLKSLLGQISGNPTNKGSKLTAIADLDGALNFVAMNNDKEWTTGDAVPETFPLSEFGRLNYESMYYPRIVIASGRNVGNNLSDKAWSTMDGLKWVQLSNDRSTFTAREGAALSYYDNCFYLIGGVDDLGVALKDVYCSKDYGVTWADTSYVMPEEYDPRGFSSVIIDKENYMLLFGGKASTDTNVLNELWRGRINRLGFKEE